MVSKRPLFEELSAILEKIGFQVRFSGKKWAQKSDLLGFFLSTQKLKKVDQKMDSKGLGHCLRSYEQF